VEYLASCSFFDGFPLIIMYLFDEAVTFDV